MFAQSENGETITQEQKLWGLMEMWSAAKYNFAYFDKVPDLDWDYEVQASIPKVLAAENINDYYLELRELAAKLNDGHTLVIPPGALNGRYDNPPIELQLIENKIILAKIGDTEETRDKNLVTGLELIAVDDIEVKDYFVKHVGKYLGGTKQYRESFGLFLLLNGTTNSKVNLKFKNKLGSTTDVELTRNSMNKGFSQRIFNMNPLIEIKMLENNIVYIKLASFQSEQIVADFKAELEKLELPKIDGMILDIRFNFGGNSQNGYDIISQLIDKPIEKLIWKSRKYIASDNAWGKPEEWHIGKQDTIEPSIGKKYTGPLIILTGSNTFSAAEDFLIPLKYSGRATLIGEKTAGSTGQPLWIHLPGGGVFTVCAVRDSYPDGKEFVGVGIEPDIEVHLTLQDIYENKDKTLEKAIEVISKLKDNRK
jgi:C-terminal processing protease CtpA/Prc